MRHTIAALRAAFLLLGVAPHSLFGSHPALALESHCVQIGVIRAALPIIVPSAREGDHLAADAAAIFVAAFNRLPPETGIEADEVLAYGIARTPAVFLIFFRDGCALEGQGHLSPDVYLDLRARSRAGSF
jgi:hypothetical protein